MSVTTSTVPSSKPVRKRRPATMAPAVQSNVPFNATGGNTLSGSLTGGLLVPGGGPLTVNGYPNLGDVIPGIVSITLVGSNGPTYTCTLQVLGACPPGNYDNKMEFTDQSSDTYTLRIYSDTRETHTVNYNSSEPNISSITWDI